MQIGIDSFAAAYDDASLAVRTSERLRNLVEQIEHADQLGLDVFGIGEHHRREFLDSAPAVILGAAATRTHRIRLTSTLSGGGKLDVVRLSEDKDDFSRASRKLFRLAVAAGLEPATTGLTTPPLSR